MLQGLKQESRKEEEKKKKGKEAIGPTYGHYLVFAHFPLPNLYQMTFC